MRDGRQFARRGNVLGRGSAVVLLVAAAQSAPIAIATAADVSTVIPDFTIAESWTPVRPWLSLDAIVGYATEDDNWAASRGEGTLFAPLSQDASQLLFLQLDGRYFFDPESQEGNFALGYRRIGDGVVHGLFASYDISNSPNDNIFQQITLGAEALGPAWDARANVYLPLTGPQNTPDTAEVVLAGSTIAMVGGQEVPLWGVDAEVGGRLASLAGGSQELWGHVGGYYFNSWSVPIEDNVYGPQARAEYRFNDILGPQSRLSLVASAKWDEARGTQLEAGARLRIPLGADNAAPLADPLRARLPERIVRDPDIMLGSSSEDVRDVLTDVVFEQVEYSTDLSGGDLGAAAAGAQMNSLLIVNEDFTGPQVIDGNGSLISNLTIAGEGGTFTVAGVNSGIEVEYTLPGARRSIMATAAPGDDVTALSIIGEGDGNIPDDGIGEGVHLVGLDVTAAAEEITGVQDIDGMYVFKVDTPIYVEDMTVRAMGAFAPLTADASAFVHGIVSGRNTGGLTILDSDIAATFDGGLSGYDNDGALNLFGLRENGSSTVNIVDSSIHADLDGDLQPGGLAAADLRGLFVEREADFTIDRSDIFATLNGNVTGGPSGGGNSATASLYGIHAERGGSFDIGNSSIFAMMDGNVVGGDGGSANSATANLYGIHADRAVIADVTDSSAYAAMDGDVMGGDGGTGNSASANLLGINALTGVDLDIVGGSVSAILDGNLTGGSGNSNRAAAVIHALSALDAAAVRIDDGSIHAALKGNLTAGDGASNSAMADVTGLNSSGSFLVDIDNSMISANMEGDLVGGGGTSNLALIELTGLRGFDGADVDIDASAVSATLMGSFWGGDGGSNNIAGANVTGVHASDSTFRVHDGSTVLAAVDGDLQGGAAGIVNAAHANIAAVLGSDSQVAVEDSSLLARLSGDLDSGLGGDASAYLAALAYLGSDSPPPEPYALSVTGSTLSAIRTGTDLSGPGSLQVGIDLYGTEPVDVLFANNRFAGTFAGPGSNLISFQDADYTVDSLSIGNTIEPGTTFNPIHCADGGNAWAGSFEIAGTTYENSLGLGPNTACAN